MDDHLSPEDEKQSRKRLGFVGGYVGRDLVDAVTREADHQTLTTGRYVSKTAILRKAIAHYVHGKRI